MVQKPVDIIFHLIIFFIVIIIKSYGAQASNNNRITTVGVILDFDSQMSKDQRLAMEVSAQTFNNYSNSHKLLLDFQDSQRDSLKAASIAEQMIKEKKAEAIIVANPWQEAALVGKIGNRSRIPVLSLSSPTMAPQDFRTRWPFLVTMSSNQSAEINCITDLVLSYKWRKIVAIYEEDNNDFGSSETSSSLLLLDKALEKIGSEIEHSLVLPPYSSLSEPKGFVLNELTKLLRVQSRAFVVLRASSPMLSHLFNGVKNLGLMEIDSAWIITEAVTNLLDHVNEAVIPMKGTLGIETQYSKESNIYKDFLSHFGRENPGIYALRAYDSVQVLTKAMEDKSGKILLNNITSASFDGLSGKISFEEGVLVNKNPIFQIVNFIGSEKISYKRINFWAQEYGFFESLDKIGEKTSSGNGLLSGSVVWPGNLQNRSPKGWAMPSIAKPLKIGVPGRTQFRKFVTVDASRKYSNDGFDGLCIRIFKLALDHMIDYHLPYEFIAFDGTYDELVEAVYNKTFDAAVGDITILANRSKYVDFTQPYLDSGLSMVIPIKAKESGMIFLKPFTWGVWAVTFCILIYTMIVVWFLEHPTNPEFNGSLRNQIGTTLWFTFSSLFFAQRERIHSNVTRVTVAMWLVLVFVVTSSYTANLSSMLTLRQIEPQIDIEWLRSTNQPIGCDGDSFIKRYLTDALGFKAENILTVQSEYAYADWFKKKNITAAFLENPYERVLINQNCNKFTSTARSFKFGGLGFAFQKGSPIVKDMSKAILKLSESGNITALEKQCLTPNECSQNNIKLGDTDSLSVKSFWGMYLISGVTSTVCFLISLVRLRQHFRRQQQTEDEVREKSMKEKAIEFARYLYKGQYGSASIRNSVSSGQVFPDLDEWSFKRLKLVNSPDVEDHDSNDINPPPERIEIAVQTTNN